jgi:hypothetical protein
MTTNGPPTPPLDETPEIENSTETVQEPVQITPTDPAPAPTTKSQSESPSAPLQAENTFYHNIFPTLVTLGIDKNYKELIRTAELFDLHVRKLSMFVEYTI